MSKRWASDFPVKVSRKQAVALVLHHLMLAAMFHETSDIGDTRLVLDGIEGDCPDHVADAVTAFVSCLDKRFEVEQ